MDYTNGNPGSIRCLHSCSCQSFLEILLAFHLNIEAQRGGWALGVAYEQNLPQRYANNNTWTTEEDIRCHGRRPCNLDSQSSLQVSSDRWLLRSAELWNHSTHSYNIYRSIIPLHSTNNMLHMAGRWSAYPV